MATPDTNAFGRQIYSAQAILPVPFDPVPGLQYWLNPLGSDDSVTWAWQFTNPISGEHYSVFGDPPPGWDWDIFAGDFAFALIGEAIPEPSGLMLLAT